MKEKKMTLLSEDTLVPEALEWEGFVGSLEGSRTPWNEEQIGNGTLGAGKGVKLGCCGW